MRTTLAIKADFEIELPSLPNFIKRIDGSTIDVKDIHPSSLTEIADAWKMALLEHAAARRK